MNSETEVRERLDGYLERMREAGHWHGFYNIFTEYASVLAAYEKSMDKETVWHYKREGISMANEWNSGTPRI